MIIPIGEKLVVKPFKSERVTQGGIVIPEPEASKRDLAGVKAKIISVGPLAFADERRYEKEFGLSDVPKPNPGDTILMAKYAGYEVEEGDEKYRVIADSDVTAVLEENDG